MDSILLNLQVTTLLCMQVGSLRSKSDVNTNLYNIGRSYTSI